MAEIDELTLTVPLDALEAGERHVLGERRELIHILSASEKKKTFMFIKRARLCCKLSSREFCKLAWLRELIFFPYIVMLGRHPSLFVCNKQIYFYVTAINFDDVQKHREPMRLSQYIFCFRFQSIGD